MSKSYFIELNSNKCKQITTKQDKQIKINLKK